MSILAHYEVWAMYWDYALQKKKKATAFTLLLIVCIVLLSSLPSEDSLTPANLRANNFVILKFPLATEISPSISHCKTLCGSVRC